MDGNHGFREIPNIIKYYPTIGNGTQLKEEYTIIHFLKTLTILCTLPNQISWRTLPTNPTHVKYTNIVVKTFYTTIG